MLILIAVIIGLYLFSKQSTVIMPPSQVGTAPLPLLTNSLVDKTPISQKPQVQIKVPLLGNDANPIEPVLPPFYQESNAATSPSPVTKSTVGNIIPQPIIQAHNNILIAGAFTEGGSSPIATPISSTFIPDNEVEQIAYENATAYGKSSVAIPITIENPPIFKPLVLSRTQL